MGKMRIWHERNERTDMIYHIPWRGNGSGYILIIHQHSIVSEYVIYTYRKACV